MSKVAVVYWSQTGNTEAMANELASAAGTEAIEVSTLSPESVADYDAFAFGCPAMGDEELDPDFEEVWNECVPKFDGKPVALFGSYDWGTGDWMDTWRENAEAAGVNVVDTLICNLEPDDEAITALQALGEKLSGELLLRVITRDKNTTCDRRARVWQNSSKREEPGSFGFFSSKQEGCVWISILLLGLSWQ